MSKMFSLRKKILLILIITPSIPLMIFLIVALREFINDKQAYILDSNLSQSNAAASGVRSRLDLLLRNSEDLFSKKVNPESLKKFAEDLGIKSAAHVDFRNSNFDSWDKKKELIFTKKDEEQLTKIWSDPDVLRANFSQLANFGLSLTADNENMILSFQNDRLPGKSEPIASAKGEYKVTVLILNKSKFLPNLFSKGANLLYLMNSDGAIIAGSDQGSEEIKSSIQHLKKNYFDKQVTFASTKINSNKSDYNLAAFSSVGAGDTYYVQLTSWKLAYSAALKLIIKTSLLFIAIISFIVMLSMYLSNQLTRTLTELTKASEKIAQRDFDLKISKKSNDELGILAGSFEKMAEEISSLLKKIEDYNRFLEQKVAERTAELFELNQLQKALMDSLEEGFMVVNSDGKLHKVHSRAAENIFQGVSEGKNFVEMVASGEAQQKEIYDWYKLLISEAMPFAEMADLGIKELVNHNNQYIKIEYYAIRSSDNTINYVVVVAKDITKERNNLLEIKKKQQQIELATKIIKNRLQVYELVKFIRQSIINIRNKVAKGDIDMHNVFLNVHTIKGNCLAFNFFSVAEIAHKFEHELSNTQIAAEDQKNKINEIITELSESLEKLVQDNILFLGKNINSGILTYELPIEQLISFFEKLKTHFDKKENDPAFLELKQQILARPIIEYIGYLDDVVADTASRQSKQVQLKFEGEDLKIVGHKLFNFFGALVHPIKNSIVHGIEYPNDRTGKGKPEVGTIKISAKKQSANILKLTIEDDGAGVSIDMVREKLTKLNKFGNIEKMTDEEVLNTFMRAGVSGQASVSIDAGRGVGSLSLTHEIDLAKGSMHWYTEKNRGTKLEIDLPI